MPCPAGKHDVVGTVYFEIVLDSGKYFEVLVEEECMDCDTRWELTEIPFWLLKVVGGKVDYLMGVGK
jgi:hypothetical protein